MKQINQKLDPVIHFMVYISIEDLPGIKFKAGYDVHIYMKELPDHTPEDPSLELAVDAEYSDIEEMYSQGLPIKDVRKFLNMHKEMGIDLGGEMDRLANAIAEKITPDRFPWASGVLIDKTLTLDI